MHAVSQVSTESQGMLVMYPPRDTVFAIITFEVFAGFFIILPELSNNVLANIRVIFLNLVGNPELIFRRDVSHLPSLSHQIEHELRDIASGYRDMLDGASNDIAFSARNNVGDTISGIDDGTREGAIGDTVGGPRRSKGKHGLYGDVKTFDIERFEEDFSSLFPVLGRIERRFSLSRCNFSARVDLEEEKGRTNRK